MTAVTTAFGSVRVMLPIWLAPTLVPEKLSPLTLVPVWAASVPEAAPLTPAFVEAVKVRPAESSGAVLATLKVIGVLAPVMMALVAVEAVTVPKAPLCWASSSLAFTLVVNM